MLHSVFRIARFCLILRAKPSSSLPKQRVTALAQFRNKDRMKVLRANPPSSRNLQKQNHFPDIKIAQSRNEDRIKILAGTVQPSATATNQTTSEAQSHRITHSVLPAHSA
jgi:hypothetical protein